MKIPSWLLAGFSLSAALVAVCVVSFSSTEVLGIEGLIIAFIFIVINSILFTWNLKNLLTE